MTNGRPPSDLPPMVDASIAVGAFDAAIESGLLAGLERRQPIDARQLAARCHLDRIATERILDTLAVAGVIETSEQGYRLVDSLDDWMAVARTRSGFRRYLEQGHTASIGTDPDRLTELLGQATAPNRSTAGHGSATMGRNERARTTTTTPTGHMNTDATPATESLSFEPPGPGIWMRDEEHQVGPRSRLVAEILDHAIGVAVAAGMARYGLPIETFRSAHLHGWQYVSIKPVGAPEGGGGNRTPPAWLLKILIRSMPELRRRNRTAAAAIESRLWHRDVEAWWSGRPALLERATVLADVDLTEADDHTLATLFGDAIELMADLLRRHFSAVGLSIPAGRLLAAGQRWDVDPDEMHALLVGASPSSIGPVDALGRLQARLVEMGVTPSSFEELRGAAPDEVATLLAEFGWRALGYDVTSPTAAEDPELILTLSRTRAGRADAEADFERARDRVRTQIPPSERVRFDELLADARAAYPAVDDNSGLAALGIGLVRRVGLEVGHRAVKRGDLAETPDVWLLGADEISALAAPDRSALVGRAELDSRRRARAAAMDLVPPMTLGGEPGPDPGSSIFPPPLADMLDAFGALMSSGFDESSSGDATTSGALSIDGWTVARGHGLNGNVTARIVVARDPLEAFERIEPGAILVCPHTGPAWNIVFPLLGGVVTEFGTPLGHTGVLAREFGIPAILGIGPIDDAWHGAEATIVGPS
ncbi:MAG: PEP-utilizing enzyme [Actinomycetota bacterium]